MGRSITGRAAGGILLVSGVALLIGVCCATHAPTHTHRVMRVHYKQSVSSMPVHKALTRHGVFRVERTTRRTGIARAERTLVQGDNTAHIDRRYKQQRQRGTHRDDRCDAKKSTTALTDQTGSVLSTTPHLIAIAGMRFVARQLLPRSASSQFLKKFQWSRSPLWRMYAISARVSSPHRLWNETIIADVRAQESRLAVGLAEALPRDRSDRVAISINGSE
jgi:hypothetical protein